MASQRQTIAESSDFELLSRYLDTLRGYSSGSILDNSEELNLLKIQHRSWLQSRRLRGLGIGYRAKAINSEDEIVIKVYVSAESSGSFKATIPTSICFPVYGQVPTEVENSEIPIAHGFDYYARPFRPGTSISHQDYERGTACALVTTKTGRRAGQNFLLSCEHVLFPSFRKEYKSLMVVQPSRRRNQKPYPEDIIARQYLRAGLKRHSVNQVDAAIALLKASRAELMNNVLAGSEFSINNIEYQPALREAVEFYGAMSGKMRGTIRDIANSESVEYRTPWGKRLLRFHNIIRCDYQCQEGDSGGPVVLARNKKLIGMHFAGNDGSAYICKIRNIFNALNIGLKRPQ